MNNSDSLKLKAQIEYTQLLEGILEKAFGEEAFKKLMEELAEEAAKSNVEFPKAKTKKFKQRK